MIRWSYGVMRPDGAMEMEFSNGEPMRPDRLLELLGGEPSFVPFRDGVVAAVRKDSSDLPVNSHFLEQGGHLRGTVVLGKWDAQKNWVGVLGVMESEEKS
jgi:hypothetical protein